MKVQQEYSGRERKAAFLFIEGGDIFCATIRLNFQIQTLEAVGEKIRRPLAFNTMIIVYISTHLVRLPDSLLKADCNKVSMRIQTS